MGKRATANEQEWVSAPKNVFSFADGISAQMHPPVSKVKTKKPFPKSLMTPLRMFFLADPAVTPLGMDCLADTGAEKEAVAGAERFPRHMVVQAPKPLKITGADWNHVFGGKTGVRLDVQTPC